eukprot:scaffold99985_cov24-Prasinocladus_malaysianus.AAC.1
MARHNSRMTALDGYADDRHSRSDVQWYTLFYPAVLASYLKFSRLSVCPLSCRPVQLSPYHRSGASWRSR